MAGQPITLTLPSNGDPFVTAAPQVVAAITALEVELERAVVPADMSMSADLSFLVASENYRVTDLLASSYVLNASQLSAVTYPRSVYFAGVEGDAYVNDGAGRQIRITSGGSVNIAATGSITSTGSPAYGSDGVELRWDGADLEYEMRAGSDTDDYGDVRLDDVIFNDGTGNFIRLGAPSIASDYTITFPTAVPASTSLVQMSSAGVLTASPSGNVATSGTVATGALTVTGASTMSSSLGVSGALSGGSIVSSTTINASGNITSSAAIAASGLVTALGVAAGASGITSAANIDLSSGAHVTVVGTGRFKHGDMQMVIPATAFHPCDAGVATPGSGSDITPGSFFHWLVRANTLNFYAPVLLPVGARIKSVVLTYFGGGGAGNRTFSIQHTTTSNDAVNTLGTTTVTTTTGIVTISHTGLTHTMATTSDVSMRVLLCVDDYLKSVLLTYDMP
jgi:hypothetical protein